MFSCVLKYEVHEIICIAVARLCSAEGLLSALLEKEGIYIPGLLRRFRIDKSLDRLENRRHIRLDILQGKAYADFICRILIILEAHDGTLWNGHGIFLSGVLLKAGNLDREHGVICIDLVYGRSAVNSHILLLGGRAFHILVEGQLQSQLVAGKVGRSVSRIRADHYRAVLGHRHYRRLLRTSGQKQPHTQYS